MPKIIDHEARRREIVAVARQIILKGGFAAATMRSIAAEAGFANGALKHYFTGKESIVAAIFESILAEMTAAIEKPDLPDAGDQLRHFLHTPLPTTADEIANGRVLLALWDYAQTNHELARLYQGFLRSWKTSFVRRLTLAHKAGAISADPPYDVLADEYMTVVIGAVVVNLLYPAGERIDAYHTYVDELLQRLK